VAITRRCTETKCDQSIGPTGQSTGPTVDVCRCVLRILLRLPAAAAAAAAAAERAVAGQTRTDSGKPQACSSTILFSILSKRFVSVITPVQIAISLPIDR